MPGKSSAEKNIDVIDEQKSSNLRHEKEMCTGEIVKLKHLPHYLHFAMPEVVPHNLGL